MTNDYEVVCPNCHGTGKVNGSSNWVAQGSTEASCWHCGTSGKQMASQVKPSCALDQHCWGYHVDVPGFGWGQYCTICGAKRVLA